MIRKLLFVLAWCVVGFASATRAEVAATPPRLVVTPDRADGVYRCGETAEFVIELPGAPEGAEVRWTLQDGAPPAKTGVATLADGRAVVRASMAKPGFVLLQATVGETTAMGGAGFDPLEITPSRPVPEDFDAFWERKKKELAAVPMDVRMTPVDRAGISSAIEMFDVRVEALGAPVSGYYARPKGAAPRSLPAILTLHGAGVASAYPGAVSVWAERGCIALDLNAHGIPNGQPKEFYAELLRGDLKNYQQRGVESRETMYFLGMYLRLVRAMEFLTAQPEWDGRTLVASGGSQGGAQAIVAAGLDARVTFISAGVPAISDLTGVLEGRVRGWPRILPETKEAAEQRPKVVEAVRYYDAMNFATRARAEAMFTVGFVDVVCPPATVYATYNNLPGTKRIINEVAGTHTIGPAAQKARVEAILEHIKTRR